MFKLTVRTEKHPNWAKKIERPPTHLRFIFYFYFYFLSSTQLYIPAHNWLREIIWKLENSRIRIFYFFQKISNLILNLKRAKLYSDLKWFILCLNCRQSNHLFHFFIKVCRPFNIYCWIFYNFHKIVYSAQLRPFFSSQLISHKQSEWQ